MLEVLRQANPSGFRGLIEDVAGLAAICVLLLAGLGLTGLV